MCVRVHGPVLALLFLVTGALEAQSIQTAARAYEEGQRAQLDGDYHRAAQLFETAFRAAPAAAALRSAIRNHKASGDHARAATLSLIALREYTSDADTRTLAQTTLDEAQSTLSRLVVTCSVACTVAIDGRLATLRSGTRAEVFVTPGEHQIKTEFEGGGTPVDQDVALEAGQVRELQVEVPVQPEVSEVRDEPDAADVPPPEPASTPTPPPPEESRGAPPYLTYIGIGVTAVVAGVLIWSVVDLLDRSDTYKATPTRELWEAGNAARNRTWVLGIAGGIAAIGTLLLATLGTDWRGETAASAWVSPEGAGLALRSSFQGLP